MGQLLSLCRASSAFAVHRWPLPCASALQRLFAVPFNICRALVHSKEPLPCAVARQSPLIITAVNPFPLRRHFMLLKRDIDAGKNTPHK
jgi:hypothetical protein